MADLKTYTDVSVVAVRSDANARRRLVATESVAAGDVIVRLRGEVLANIGRDEADRVLRDGRTGVRHLQHLPEEVRGTISGTISPLVPYI